MNQFQRFLEARGVKKISKSIETFENPRNNEEVFDFLNLKRIGDSDLFYYSRCESFQTNSVDAARSIDGVNDSQDDVVDMSDDDDEEEELIIREREYEQYVNGFKKPLPYLDPSPYLLSTVESKPLNNPHDPNYTLVDVHSIATLTRLAPSHKFPDLLQLDYVGSEKLLNHEFTRKYKNNLSDIITAPTGENYLLSANNSEIMIYEFSICKIPEITPVLQFDTKPIFTTTTDRLISTWPYFPHTINYMKVAHWLGHQVLGVCCDDGSLMIYYTDYLVECIEKYSTSRGLKIRPELQLKLDSSVWGLDFLSYIADGMEHNLILTSDNSQSLSLFYFHVTDHKFYHVKTHQLLHNIPDCSFLSHEIRECVHVITATCVSVSGELIIFQFEFTLVEGPLPDLSIVNNHQHIYYVDPSIQQLEQHIEREPFRFNRIEFSFPLVTKRTLIHEDCWTSRPIKKKYFKSVSSLGQVFGDDRYNEEAGRILSESLIFHEIQYNFGICKDWQHFQVPVIQFEEVNSGSMTSLDDSYRRLNKMFTNQKDPAKEQEENLLVVSTAKKVGLFNDFLYCHCSTPTVFNLTIPSNDDSRFSNRISITKVIPKLSAFLAVSQQGMILVFRLCEYKGVYGMRQEQIFPNAMILALGLDGYRTINGVAIRDYSPCPSYIRYFIYVIYTDGLTLTFELSKKMDIGIVDL